MRQPDHDDLALLEAELFEQAGGMVPVADIRLTLHQALRDLAGSVSSGSLPEMASRLTLTRLAGAEFRVSATV